MKKAMIIVLVSFLLTAAGCSSAPAQAPQGNKSSSPPAYVKQVNEPVTITAFLFPAQKKIFNDYVIPGLKQKYPQLTVEILESNKLEQLISSGQLPDLYAAANGLQDYINVNLTMDLTPLIKKHHLDLSSIDPGLIESIKGFSDKGALLALPAGRSVNSLIYNKDIFNKFGVAFPKDGMKWDELINLAKRLTRSEDGIKYHGLHPNKFDRLASQLELPYFDGTGKAKVTTAGWQEAANTWKAIYDIPNNKPVQEKPDVAFIKDKNTAMILRNPLFLLRDGKPPVDWDLTTFPTFENNLGPDELGAVMGVTSVSKHPDEAFLVLDYYYSAEFQMEHIRSAEFLPLSADPNVQKHFAENVKELHEKNLQSLFIGKHAHKITEKNEGIAEETMDKLMADISKNKDDINTILRMAEEKINKAVEELSVN